MPGYNRKGKHVIAERVALVEQMLQQGYTYNSIQKALAQKWGVKERQIRAYISKVYAQWDKDAAELRTTAPQRVVYRRRQFEGLLELAVRRNDLKAAGFALDKLCRIDGCYPTEQIDVNARVGMGIGLGVMGLHSHEQVQERIAELKARMLNGGPISGSLPEPRRDVDDHDGTNGSGGDGAGTLN